MLIDLTGLKPITTVESHTCDFHQKNPGMHYAGCTCSGGYSQKWVKDENPPQPCPHCKGTGTVNG